MARTVLSKSWVRGEKSAVRGAQKWGTKISNNAYLRVFTSCPGFENDLELDSGCVPLDYFFSGFTSSYDLLARAHILRTATRGVAAYPLVPTSACGGSSSGARACAFKPHSPEREN